MTDGMKLRLAVVRRRTERAKALRRRHGDRSGLVRFADKETAIGGRVMGTLTASPSKENLVAEIDL